MTTVKDIDRLVVSDDAIAARIWPRVGPRVQTAYLNDRDRWVGLRRRVEAGETLTQTTLVSEHKVFTGWARAFRAAAGTKQRPATKKQAPAPTGRLAATTATAAMAAPAAPATAPAPSLAEAIVVPPLAAVTKSTGGAGAAAAGGLLALAGLVAFAARRKRS